MQVNHLILNLSPFSPIPFKMATGEAAFLHICVHQLLSTISKILSYDNMIEPFLLLIILIFIMQMRISQVQGTLNTHLK